MEGNDEIERQFFYHDASNFFWFFWKFTHFSWFTEKKCFKFLTTFCNDISSFLINSILTLQIFKFLQIILRFFLLKLNFFSVDDLYFHWFFGICLKKNGFIYIILIKWSNKNTFVWFFFGLKYTPRPDWLEKAALIFFEYFKLILTDIAFYYEFKYLVD